MPKFKTNSIESILYFLHLQGYSPIEATKKLMEITNFTINNQEIIEIYEKTIREFTLMEETQEERELRLKMVLRVPEVQNRIAMGLDLGARLSLLRTTTDFRYLSIHSPLQINTLTIRYTTDYLLISTDDGYQQSFIQNGSSDENGPSEFIQKGYCTLKRILSFPNLRLTTLQIQLECSLAREEMWYMNDRVVDIFRNIFPRSKLKLEHIKGTCDDGKILSYILSHVEPVGLKSMNFKLPKGDEDDTAYAFDVFKDFYNLEQWKKAKKFVCEKHVDTDEFWKNYSHFECCKMRLVKPPTIRNITELIKKLLKNPRLQEFKLRTVLPPSDLKFIKKKYGIKNEDDWVEIAYPNDKKLLLIVTDGLIWFKGPCYVEEEEEEWENSDEDEEEEESDDD